LRITARPKRDESPAGYVLRLAELNGYESPWPVLCLSGLGKNFHNFQFVFGDQWDVGLLADVAGVARSELSALKYGAAPAENSVHRYEVFGSPIPRYFIRPKQPKVCPECLRESGYCRKAWELAPVTACPIHRRLLMDECPNCKRPVSWIRGEVSVCPCRYDWRETTLAPVEDSELSVVRRVYRLCNLDGVASPGKAEESPLDPLDLEHTLSALFFVAAQHSGVIDTTGKFSVKGRRNAELHDLITRSARVFDAWPKNFEVFLEWRRAQPNNSKLRTGLHRDFGTFYHGLYFNLAARDFDFMRRAFEDYVAGRWTGGYAATITRRKGVVLKDRRYVTKTEARNRLRVEALYIDRLIEAGRLDAVVRERGKKRMYLIELDGLERLELEFRELLAAEEVAEMLRVSVTVIDDLVSYLCLIPHRGPTVDGLPFWKFAKGTVNELLDRLGNLTPREPAPAASETVDFSTALRALSRRRYGVASFLRAILDGRIIPCGKGKGGGIKSMLFRKEDVAALPGEGVGRPSEHLYAAPTVIAPSADGGFGIGTRLA